MTQYLVLDVGGSSIKHALADDAFTLTHQGSVPNTFAGHDDFIEAIGRLFDACADRVSGIAISTCGELDPDTGHMFSGGALRFNAGTNMIAAVQARCPLPVSVENDANCALLAEVHDGSLTGCRNAAALVIGTGVGGALLINGRLHHGSHFHAGNASVVLPSLSEPYDPTRILAMTNGVVGLTRPLAMRKGLDAAVLDGRAVFELVEAGDAAALAVLDAFCGRLAAFIYNVQVLLDLDAVAIGGGISAQPAFVEGVRDKVKALFDASIIPLPAPKVVPCRHRNDANLIGALVHHLRPRPDAAPVDA